MTDYDELFDQTAPTDSVFADKRALDPLRPAAESLSPAFPGAKGGQATVAA